MSWMHLYMFFFLHSAGQKYANVHCYTKKPSIRDHIPALSSLCMKLTNNLQSFP